MNVAFLLLTVVSKDHLKITQAFKSAPHDLENEQGDPPFFFFAFLAKLNHYLSAWQVKKKFVRGSVLGANVLNSVIGSKFSRHFFNKSEVKPKPIVARACTFSRALCRLRVIT